MVDNNCIIEGNVKFRDGKKWKSRWCVMRKLSPVADCLHLQLYGDSKDRYKQGQTKASLSLQHFLGVQSGFTLDKESNTIAIICQDVTVVLAFDTRERLIQWQVKISNNLGEDQQFLVLVSSAPAKAKLSSGPARLHVQERRFCMTAGLPPRLLGLWEIGQLRRYGVVEGRFCFEGGSRCGRGEGLHVLVTDRAEEIARALRLAAEGRLGARRRPEAPSAWASTEVGLRDSSSLASGLAERAAAAAAAAEWRSCSLSRAPRPGGGERAACLERCSSCAGKLGALSRSAGAVAGAQQPRAYDRLSLSSYGSSGQESDCSGSQQRAECRCSPQPRCQPGRCPSPAGLPPRPPKPSSAAARRARKPPMPLPQEQACTCARRVVAPRRNVTGPYENYDIPKPILTHHTPLEQQSPQVDQFYDTPKKIKECLATTQAYPNYDTPHVPQPVVLQQCGCPAKLPSHTPKSLACPCHNVMSWAGFVLPYCRRGAGIEHTGVSVQPVRLSGEGKMPVVNASGQLGIYNSTSNGNIVEAGKALCNTTIDSDCPVHSTVSAKSNYENIDPVIDAQAEPKAPNYANIEFTESLGNYENSKDIFAKVGISSQEKSDKLAEQVQKLEAEDKGSEEKTTNICRKCGHLKEVSEDYLVVDEENEIPKKPVAGYIPMQPAHNTCSKEIISRLCGGEKSSSNPALSGVSSLEVNRKRSESEYRVPGSAMLSSPYFRRRLLDMSNSEAGNSLGILLRKRSYSVESAHYLDDEKTAFTPNVPIHKCHSDTDKMLANNEIAECETEANDSMDATSFSAQPLASIKIRRSSSVPSKTGHNRDSSSSNDSGVSTGSLNHRTGEFVEFEFPCTPANTLVKKQSVPLMFRKSPPPACFHSSLPRKSKSSDPIKELTFQFHKTKLPTKSSSAEADIPTCLPSKGSKEFTSPGDGTSAPYIDSRSTSSGTSDMSDYIETLSLSSHSSSDAPDNLRIGGRTVTTTLRPRSGKEYYKIDRSMLVEQGQTNSTSSNYVNITPFARKETH